MFPPELTPRILFEDNHLMVISKPAGLLSQGEKTGDVNLVDWARSHVGRNYVGLVHRLDRNTSGLMVLGKRTKAAQRLTEQLQNGTLKRVYRAWLLRDLAVGAPLSWRHFLVKDEKTNTVRTTKTKSPGAKEALLTVRAIERGSMNGIPITLAEFELETGRSHQIRAQAAAEGHPLLGDIKYGARENQGLSFPRPALHSFKLSFEHPMSRELLAFEDQLPEDMRSIRPLR